MFTAWLWRQKPKAIEGQKGADFWHAVLLYEGAFERGRGGWDYLCQGCVCAAACSGGHRPWQHCTVAWAQQGCCCPPRQTLKDTTGYAVCSAHD